MFICPRACIGNNRLCTLTVLLSVSKLFPTQVKSRSSYKLFTAAAACPKKKNNLGLSASSSVSYFTLIRALYCAINIWYASNEI